MSETYPLQISVDHLPAVDVYETLGDVDQLGGIELFNRLRM